MTEGYRQREKWAIEQLAADLERILIGFNEAEQKEIRPKLANYTFGYLGVREKLVY